MNRTARGFLLVLSVALPGTTSFAQGQTAASTEVTVVNTPGLGYVEDLPAAAALR